MTRLVRAELRKLLTTRLLLGLTLGGVVLVAFYVVVFAFAAGSSNSGQANMPSLSHPEAVRSVYGMPVEIGYIIPMVMGVIMICGEYRHRTISSAFLATPRRARVLAAKALTALLVGLGMGVLFTVEAVGLGAIVVAARGYPVLLTSHDIPRMIPVMILALGVWGVYGFGFGALLKNQVAAVLAAIALVTLVEQLLTLFLRWIHLRSVARLLPSNVAGAIVSPSGLKPGDALPWWGGMLSLLAWGVLMALLGAVITARRDVT